jgi:iron complex outermembrane receptor protein
VNLGTTDVDSPTAAASGSTVNYRSRNPTEDFHARMIGSAGEYGYMRIFGEVDTGNLTAGGLRAWLAASNSRNDTIYGGIGKIEAAVQRQAVPAAGQQRRLHLDRRPL